ncbi:MAG: hypothetical protein NWF09_06655 [Candidatus Bathyarchaeota archaeon]|nr:hypothetical protein [Candidatus Bathyarchaeota archaeon]
MSKKVLVEAQTHHRQGEPDLTSIQEFKRHLTSLTQQLRNIDEKAKTIANSKNCIYNVKVIEKTQSTFCAKLDQWVSSRYCSICHDFSPTR